MMTDTSIGIDTEQRDGILTLCLNRPQKKNALTAVMYQVLADALNNAHSDEATRAILITGQPQAFTAGNDLEDFMHQPPLSPDSPVFQFMHQMVRATKPIVAAVSGMAIGIGTTMLLHCDLVYAADNARFSLPFAQLGLCPEFASSLLLPQTIGHQHAAEKLMLGEKFSAVDAHALGLVNKVLPGETLLTYAKEQAQKLAALPALSLRQTKQLMKADSQARIEAKIVEENEVFRQLLQAPEAKNAMAAFFAQRKPHNDQ